MPKTIFKFILLTMCLLSAGTATAYDFYADGFYFNKINADEVEVTYRTSNGEDYSGEIVIPQKVSYNGNSYKVTAIGKSAFNICTNLTSVTIPNSVTSIGADAFSRCETLKSVTIPNSVTSIGSSAFHRCGTLQQIIVDQNNNNYKSINGSLYNKTVTILIRAIIPQDGKFSIPNSVTAIQEKAFSSYSSLKSVTIPNSVTSIGNSAFFACTYLTSVTIPNSVTSIGNSAFLYCESLTSVTIPNSVTSIGNSAFLDCKSLTSVTIPNSVTSIGADAFKLCNKIQEISCGWSKPISCAPIFPEEIYKTAILYVPKGTTAEYEKVMPWKAFWEIQESDSAAIDEIQADEELSHEKQIFNLNGVHVGASTDGLPNGVYIVKNGNKTSKIIL